MKWRRPRCILQNLFAQLESGSGWQRTSLCWPLGTSPWAPPQGQDRRTSGAGRSTPPGVLATALVCILPLAGVALGGQAPSLRDLRASLAPRAHGTDGAACPTALPAHARVTQRSQGCAKDTEGETTYSGGSGGDAWRGKKGSKMSLPS